MKPTRGELIIMLEAYKTLAPENSCGGSLHIFTDDGNCEDSHVAFCMRYAEEKGDYWGHVLAQAFLMLTTEERESFYNEYWGTP